MKLGTKISTTLLALYMGAMSAFAHAKPLQNPESSMWGLPAVSLPIGNPADRLMIPPELELPPAQSTGPDENIIKDAKAGGLLKTYGEPAKAPTDPEELAAKQAAIEQEKEYLAQSFARMQENGLWDAVHFATNDDEQESTIMLLRMHNESGGGKVLQDPNSSAQGKGIHYTNETCFDSIYRHGEDILKRLEQQDTEGTRALAALYPKIRALGPDGLQKMNAALANVREAANAPPAYRALYRASVIVRNDSLVSSVLHKVTEDARMATLSTETNAFEHKYLTPQLRAYYIALFGDHGAARLINALRDSSGKTMGNLFSKKLRGQNAIANSSVAAYVKRVYEKEQIQAEAARQTYEEAQQKQAAAQPSYGPEKKISRADTPRLLVKPTRGNHVAFNGQIIQGLKAKYP